MGHPKRLGSGDTAVLLAVNATGYGKSSGVVKRVAAATGEDPLDAYATLVSLGLPWLTPSRWWVDAATGARRATTRPRTRSTPSAGCP